MEMERYGNADIMMRLLVWLDEQKDPVVIFGAGFVGWQIADALLYAGKEVRCFADNMIYPKSQLSSHIKF